ncbi:hypothetical protein Rin_00009150 [Candidatus Regiella insecticola 5.15]|uniref:DUF1640 domain-containing protein n=1 Tax=Candidatus Regiella insecticola 5.15 TaxID=1005043 RepID=G2GYQ5_9ENTR|nr:hypothetical protein [Candidatus Regiella insecticola]EGY29133.1 hypothetical protein Rin_00009150 [Candidatus Regiella insecticola 5.15]
MSSLVFDTHNFVKKLTKAGMPEVQAEILASEQANLIENLLAIKKDIALPKQDTALLEKNMKMKIESAKSNLIKWVAGLLMAQAALVAALLKLFAGA